MEGPELKKRKIHKPPPRRTVASPASKTPKDAKPMCSSRVPGVQTSDINNFRVQQEKKICCSSSTTRRLHGNFKKFDSWYGNFLVPVVPSRAELNR